MTTLPDNLADADLALLYLADELPPAEREAWAARLEADPALRALVAALAGVQDAVFGAFDAADPRDPLASARGAVLAMEAAVRDHRRPAVARRHGRPWWLGTWMLYPVGAAAAVTVGFYVWWNSIEPEDGPKPYLDRPVLALRADANADLSTLSDEQVVDHGLSIVLEDEGVPRRFLVRSLLRLDYLERSLP